jgi:hypothetical protein
VAVFNLGESAQNLDLSWSDLGVGSQAAGLRDLWRRKDLGAADGIHIQLRPHASALYRIQTK